MLPRFAVVWFHSHAEPVICIPAALISPCERAGFLFLSFIAQLFSVALPQLLRVPVPGKRQFATVIGEELVWPYNMLFLFVSCPRSQGGYLLEHISLHRTSSRTLSDKSP